MQLFTVYVNTYIKDLLLDRYVEAGQVHRIEFKIQAVDETAALVEFRMKHPSLEVAQIMVDEPTSNAQAALRMLERTHNQLVAMSDLVKQAPTAAEAPTWKDTFMRLLTLQRTVR